MAWAEARSGGFFGECKRGGRNDDDDEEDDEEVAVFATLMREKSMSNEYDWLWLRGLCAFVCVCVLKGAPVQTVKNAHYVLWWTTKCVRLRRRFSIECRPIGDIRAV